MIPASWMYHFKFMLKDGAIVFPQFVTGWKNVSIAGGLLALILLDTSRVVIRSLRALRRATRRLGSFLARA
jgi:hypothetical protein